MTASTWLGAAALARGPARPVRWLAMFALAALGGCAQLGLPNDPYPPVVFVHGEGESAALWQTAIWRFESSGWPRDRLYAVEVPQAAVGGEGAGPQPGSPAPADPPSVLAGEVERVLARTGARKVVLVGNERGGVAIHGYVKKDAGAVRVWRTVLGRAPIVLPSLDQREVAFDPRSFEHTWWRITGQPASRTAIVPESAPVLDGRVSVPGTSAPMAGVSVEVYEVMPRTGERLGAPVHVRVTGADGRWGPMAARSDAPYEFVLAAPGWATTHIYRSAFPRSSSMVHMQPARLDDAERAAGSVVVLWRPRGELDPQRERVRLGGAVPPDVRLDAVGVSEARLLLPPGPVRTVVAEFNGERIAVRTWPASENRAVFAELHY